jgi:hypothetical protein
MKNKILLAIIIVSALTLGGCGRVAVQPVKTTTAPSYKFSAIKNPQKMTHTKLIVYKPADWQEVKQGLMLYYLPPNATTTDPLAEKIVAAVYSVSATSTDTLAEFMKNDFTADQKTMPTLKFVTSTDTIKVGSLIGREEKDTVLFSGKKVDITQVEAHAGNMLYKIQHYCLDGKCQGNDIFTEMIGSFEPIAQNTPEK